MSPYVISCMPQVWNDIESKRALFCFNYDIELRLEVTDSRHSCSDRPDILQVTIIDHSRRGVVLPAQNAPLQLSQWHAAHYSP